jgi:DNA-directed RNA polymerase subunit RPC12/RpoP
MPHYKCTDCHHEFDHIPTENEEVLCDWCGASVTVLEEQTSFEEFCEILRDRKKFARIFLNKIRSK